MLLELALLLALAGAFGLVWWRAARRSERVCAQVAYSPTELDTSGTVQRQLLAQAFPEPAEAAAMARWLDAWGFQFRHDGSFLPDLPPDALPALLQSLFTPAQRALARQHLERYGPHLPHPGRVHLAALRLSGGDVTQLATVIDAARRDWLGVCQQAEAPNGFGEYVRWLRAQSAPSAPTAWPAPPPISPPAC
jgi:hypothetical protein